jgi:hypothetical protein
MVIWLACVPMVRLYESQIQNFVFPNVFHGRENVERKATYCSVSPHSRAPHIFFNENVGKGFSLTKLNLSFRFGCRKQKEAECMILRNNKFKM